MNKIIDKRNSLERFIREQTLGPGINGYRYVDIENETLVNQKLIGEAPMKFILASGSGKTPFEKVITPWWKKLH